MAIDYRIGSKVGKQFRREDTAATRLEPYPYIGIVKNNLDPIRAGRLQVWIPDLGGNEDDPRCWQTVSYASPFMGYTSQPENVTENKFENTTHTYGMWMVPPDIGVQVIVIFIAGDPLRGYFVGCVNPNISRYMLPGLAGTNNTDIDNASAGVKETAFKNTMYPVTEFNENDPTLHLRPNILSNPKPIHEPQYKILLEQGLDADPVRGVITSSSQRETPSNVFGISTPGRALNDPADDPNFVKKVQEGDLTEEDYAVRTRKGGHTFVMDDGDVLGRNQLLRLRSSSGHQILLHDTDDSIYIGAASGKSWIELDKLGRVNVYSSGSISLRSESNINFLADQNVNIEAKGSINMVAGEKIQQEARQFNLITTQGINLIGGNAGVNIKSDAALNVDATGKISVKSQSTYTLDATGLSELSGGGVSVTAPKIIERTLKADTAFLNGRWAQVPNAIETIVTVAPTHEPFPRSLVSSEIPVTKLPVAIKPQAKWSGSTDQTETNSTVDRPPASLNDLLNQPTCDCKIGNLTAAQKTALFAVIAKNESGPVPKEKLRGVANGKSGYQCVNSLGYLGKYQMGRMALQNKGVELIKSHVTLNSKMVTDPNSWVGGAGKPNNYQEFLDNEALQEEVMCKNTLFNYTVMALNGAITESDSAEKIGGMLYVAHLLGPQGAYNYRNGKDGADDYGTTGSMVYPKGKWAIAVLSKQQTTPDAPDTTG